MLLLNNYKKHTPVEFLNLPLFLDKPLSVYLKFFSIKKKNKICKLFRYLFSSDSFITHFPLNYQNFFFLKKIIRNLTQNVRFTLPHSYTSLFFLSLKATAGLIRLFRFLKGYRSRGQSNRRPKHYFKNRCVFYKKNLNFKFNNFFFFYIPNYYNDLFFYEALAKQALKLQYDQSITYAKRLL